MSPGRERPEWLEWDWAVIGRGTRLHHVAAVETVDPDGAAVTGLSTCGKFGEYRMPGLLSRMRRPRCGMCCYRLGIARGAGSPKNHLSLRMWVEDRLASLPVATNDDAREGEHG